MTVFRRDITLFSDIFDLLLTKREQLPPNRLTRDERIAVVDRHNDLRSLEPASNMKYMVKLVSSLK